VIGRITFKIITSVRRKSDVEDITGVGEGWRWGWCYPMVYLKGVRESSKKINQNIEEQKVSW